MVQAVCGRLVKLPALMAVNPVARKMKSRCRPSSGHCQRSHRQRRQLSQMIQSECSNPAKALVALLSLTTAQWAGVGSAGSWTTRVALQELS
ncbi:hypothetical protein LIA77_10606 [Sarocladium implicatum]|nr:hypothetical protein LIA77_10606 [Sarocladium implicatum]